MLSNILLSVLTPYADAINGNHLCEYDVINRLLIRCCTGIRYWEKNGIAVGHYVHHLFIDLKNAYDLHWRGEVLYSTLIEFRKLIKVVRLIKMCLREVHSKVYMVNICLMHCLFRMV
jgi:hypothetical protein